MARTIDVALLKLIAQRHFGDNIDAFVEDVYAASDGGPQLRLGELTDAIAKLNEGMGRGLIVKVEGHDQFPCYLDSYRGSYDQLAIGLSDRLSGERWTVPQFLQKLREADGCFFTGYKGGEFRMHASTPVWVSNYGECSDLAVTGVEARDGFAVITTKKDD